MKQTSLRVLMFTYGSGGEIYPYVALGQALKERGHRVGLGADDQFRDLCLEQGLDFLPIDPPEPIPRQLSKRSWFAHGMMAWRFRTSRILELMPSVYEKIEQQRVPGQTVAVAKSYMFGARIAQEKLGIPLATLHLTPAMVRSSYDAPGLPLPRGSGMALRLARRLFWYAIDRVVEPMIAPGLNRFRSGLGLLPVKMPFRGWHVSPDLGICMFPDWFAPPKPDWPENISLVGFPMFEPIRPGRVTQDLDSFIAGGEPPVLFTRGYHIQKGDRFFEESVTACRLLGKRGLLLSPDGMGVPPELPEGIRQFGYIPFGAVFPRVAVIVHHGGIGTTTLALASGRPQVVVSRVDDQRDNGLRITELGTGSTIRFDSYNGKTVAKHISRLLASVEVENRCQEICVRVRQTNGIYAAANLIEQLGTRS